MEASAATATPPSPPLLRRLTELDTALSLRIHAACRPVPRLVLKALEISGDGRFWFPIPIALLPLTAGDPVLVGLLLGSLFDLLLIGLLKHLVRRPRPVYNKGMHLTFAVDHWSFPSGHSSRVFFIASFLYLSASSLRLPPDAHRWIRDWYSGESAENLVPIVFLWSAATSASRVLLGRHFVLDVIAGASLGVLEALIVYYFLKFQKFYKDFRSIKKGRAALDPINLDNIDLMEEWVSEESDLLDGDDLFWASIEEPLATLNEEDDDNVGVGVDFDDGGDNDIDENILINMSNVDPYYLFDEDA